MLDMGQSGTSLLSTSQLTEVFKVNNLYHFNLDFQSAFRVNKLKILFLERNSQKQQRFKMRVIISVPDGVSQESGQDAPRFRVIFCQLFDENQIHQINQIAFKKSSMPADGLSQQNKLTIDLDRGVDKSGQSGVLTRYMTVQVHLLETMKSLKDQAHMTTDCLMFPQAFGFVSNEQVPSIKSFDIAAPTSETHMKTTPIGFDQALLYNVGESTIIQSNKSKKGAKLANKIAVFAPEKESNTIENAEQFEVEKKSINDLREELKKLMSEDKGDYGKLIGALVGSIKKVKQKFAPLFAMSKDVTYDYLIKFREILCLDIID